MAQALYDRRISLKNEVRFKEFYYSGEPETTPNYPLETYFHPAVQLAHSVEGDIAALVKQSVTAPGEMLIVENTVVSCACIRDCSPHTEKISTNTPTTVPSDRIPSEVHKHLAFKFGKLIMDLAATATAKDKVLLKSIRLLDARPVNVQAAMNSGSRKENQGPWNKVKTTGGRKQSLSLDYDRLWNIIANHARCFKVRSKTREEPSQVKTCEFWGMWILSSFINHSCVPNCHAMRVGDAIIIRAARAIPTGQALTLPYFDIFQPLCKRELAARKWGFRCNCIRCGLEGLLGEDYDDIQKQVVNLERQIQMSWAWEDVKRRRKVVDSLLDKLFRLHYTPIKQLITKFEQRLKNDMIDNEQREVLKLSVDCIFASFSQTLIAWYALALQNAYESPLQPDILSSAKKAKRFRDLITCVQIIIALLSPIHPGNLLCEEFWSILLKARNDLIDHDLDKKLTADVASQESYVTMANVSSRSYYGPNVKVFESMKHGMIATDLTRGTILSPSITQNGCTSVVLKRKPRNRSSRKI